MQWTTVKQNTELCTITCYNKGKLEDNILGEK